MAIRRIDPNKVNISVDENGKIINPTGLVQPENLFIYVDLEVEKKPRTIITNSGVHTVNSNENHIGFLSGSKNKDSDKPYLTTNYTRLTTILTDSNGEPESESFGITSINIEFNSSFAPMITIEMVDVRGASLFEKGNESKYNMFFNMPYPVFKLTVKGFYGPAVVYCLHLLKFQSRFNSNTGNFEITCQFIGYTFAFLSDMLMGYLRAATETTLGKQIFERKQREDPELITINTLLLMVNDVHNEMEKKIAHKTEVDELANIDKYPELYDGYLNEVKRLMQVLKLAMNDSGEILSSDGNDVIVMGRVIDYNLSKAIFNNNGKSINEIAKSINTDISLNTSSTQNYKLPEDIEKAIKIRKFKETEIDSLTNYQKNIVKQYSNFSEDKNITYTIFDFSEVIDKVNKAKVYIEKRKSELVSLLSDGINNTILRILGYPPFIRNFVKIFTAHIEVFMEIIRETSRSAMEDASGKRKEALEKLVNNLSLKANDPYYPFPEYYDNNATEKYIGSVLENSIQETELVEEFLKAFLEVQRQDNELQNRIQGDIVATYPTNMLDLFQFKSIKDPYVDLFNDPNFNNLNQIFLASVIRLFNIANCNASQYSGFKYNKNFGQYDFFNLIGRFEGLNLYNALIKSKANDRYIISLRTWNYNNENEALKALKKLFIEGHESFKLPNGAKQVMRKSGSTFEYIYIRERASVPNDYFERVYLPSFIKPSLFNSFYSGEYMLGFSELKELNVFKNNDAKYISFGYLSTGTMGLDIDDGSSYFMILDNEDTLMTSKFIFPSFSELESLPANEKEIFNKRELNEYSFYNSYDELEVKNLGWWDGYISEGKYLIPDKVYYKSNSNSFIEYTAKPYADYYNQGVYSNILETTHGLNDMTYLKIEKNNEENDEGSNTTELFSSSVYFFRDITAGEIEFHGRRNFWYATVPFNLESISEQKKPRYFIDFKVGDNKVFGPLCYPLDRLANDYPQILGLTTTPQDLIILNEDFPVVTNNNDAEVNSIADTIYSFIDSSAKKFSDDENAQDETGDGIIIKKNQHYREQIGNIRKVINNTINGIIQTRRKGGERSSEDDGYTVGFVTPWTFGINHVQLFGSELYFEQQRNQNYQDAVYARAYLFLHMLPLHGNYMTNYIGTTTIETNGTNDSLDIKEDINNCIKYNKVPEITLRNCPKTKFKVPTGYYDNLSYPRRAIDQHYNYWQSEWHYNSEQLFNIYGPSSYKGYISNTSARDYTLSQPGVQKVPYCWILEIGSDVWYEKNPDKVYYKDKNGYYVVAGLTDNPKPFTTWMAEDSFDVPLTQFSKTSWSKDRNYKKFLPKSFLDYCYNEFLKWADINSEENLSWNDIRHLFEIYDFDNFGTSPSEYDAARQKWQNDWINFKFNRQYLADTYKGFGIADTAPYIVFQPFYKNYDWFYKIKIQNNGDIPSDALTGQTFSDAGNHSGYGMHNGVEINFGDPQGCLLRYDYICVLNMKSDVHNETYLKFLAQEKFLLKSIPFAMGERYLERFPKIYESAFDSFYRGFLSELQKRLNKKIEYEKDNNEIKKQLFNTIDDDLIKLTIYKHLGNIYNKWIGGSQNDKFIDCVANKEENLINRFQFIDRAYNDIGDKLIINPFNIIDSLVNNPNISFYNFLGQKILASNNIDFIALPTFIDLRSVTDVESIFKTHYYADRGGFQGISGPSFVCMYIGQTSQHLDLGKNGDFINDGVNLWDDNDVPPDLSESSLPVFLVKYGDQTQSIFKNVKLDQMEFSETEESLQAISNLADNRKAFIGQNLFNIYQMRSYTAEVEMLGNFAIQPYMYFQLDNIPMFRGGYMIIKVSHNITPHMATTTFRGVRIKKAKTPLIDKRVLYLNIINEFGDGILSSISTIELNEESFYDDVAVSSGDLSDNNWDDQWFTDGIMDIDTIHALNPTPPVNGYTTITSGIEYREANTRPHYGVDIAAPAGTPVYAIADGYVTLVGIIGGGGGLTIQTNHEVNGKIIACRYMHLNSVESRFLPDKSKTLDDYTIQELKECFYNKIKVSRGEKIGLSGGNKKTAPRIEYVGVSTGPHLHFEIRTIPPTGKYEMPPNSPNALRNNDPNSSQKDKSYPIIHDPMQIFTQFKYKGRSRQQVPTLITYDENPNPNKITESEMKSNMILIKRILKEKGLTKVQAAAIMGNMYIERRFNPTALSSDGKYYGLIQWSKDYNHDKIGKTIQEQIDFLFNKTYNFNKWVNETKYSNDVSYVAYKFASDVEICYNCNKGLETYNKRDEKGNSPSDRSKNAVLILKSFNDVSDPLYWDL